MVARVLPGNDLVGAIEEICRRHQLRQAMIVSTIGSLIDPTLHYVTSTTPQPGKGHTSDMEIRGPGSLIAGQGLVCQSEDGSKVEVHLHCVVGDSEGNVRGGHFFKGGAKVLTTTDVSLVEIVGVRIFRRPHPVTGVVFTDIQPG